MYRPMITSTTNPLIKRLRALRTRKGRDEAGASLVEGIRLVAAAAESGAILESIIIAPDRLTSLFARDLIATQAARDIPIAEVSAAVFESFSGKENPQGIAAIVRQSWTPLTAIQPENALFWVALRAAQDPGNIGTILRTCDAVGAAGVIFLDGGADPYDPSAIRASMGALFALRVARASFESFAAWVQGGGWQVVGAADHAAHSYRAYAYPAPLILLMGSEREGLTTEQQALCTAMVAIPQVGSVDSLNLAVATGILLYEIFHQRRTVRIE